MNEHMTVGELFYCLIQDIEDYLMHYKDDGLEFVLGQLYVIKEKYDIGEFNRIHLNFLISTVDYLRTKSEKDNKYLQFYLDIKIILERIQNEIKGS